ncbi:MAG: MFS transporter [Clostridia bacterium]|nr:MFS transporter [Clostridia bacterium]
MKNNGGLKRGGLSVKHWFGYMFGDFGGCMTFALMSSIFSIYCTNVLGVKPWVMGILTIVWTVWDAINDPLMGALMDKAFAKNKNKRGKFRPWLLRATPLLAVSAIALWTVPTFMEGIPLLVALFSFKILYEGAYTMFNIPMGSLLSAMSTNDTERASLSSSRGVGSMFGNMIPGMVGPVVIGMFGDTRSTGYMIVGCACAVVGFVLCLLHYAMTEERRVVLEKTNPDDVKLTDILQVFSKNRAFVALCIHGVCICVMQFLTENISMYMYSAVYDDVTYKTIASVLSMPFMAGSMIAVPFICKKYGLEKVIRYCLLLGGAICVLLFALHLVLPIGPLVHGVLLGIGTGFAMVSIQMQWGLWAKQSTTTSISRASVPKVLSTEYSTLLAVLAKPSAWASAFLHWNGSTTIRSCQRKRMARCSDLKFCACLFPPCSFWARGWHSSLCGTSPHKCANKSATASKTQNFPQQWKLWRTTAKATLPCSIV